MQQGASICLFGGSFDPIHGGHLHIAGTAQQLCALKKIIFLPAACSPFKQGSRTMFSDEQRLQMLRLAIGEDPTLQLCDLELQRGGISYTWETVEQLREMYPQAELVLFMGTDMFLIFRQWKNPERILKNVSLGYFTGGSPVRRKAFASRKRSWRPKVPGYIW